MTHLHVRQWSAELLHAGKHWVWGCEGTLGNNLTFFGTGQLSCVGPGSGKYSFPVLEGPIKLRPSIDYIGKLIDVTRHRSPYLPLTNLSAVWG